MTSDTKVRQAIMYAIDKETICQALYGSIGETATHGLVAPQYFGYVDLGVQPYDPEKPRNCWPRPVTRTVWICLL